MRVAIAHPVFWPEVRRGSERFARELADGLLARGHRPRIVAGHRGLRRDTAVEEGVAVVRVPRLPERRLERRMFEHHLTHVPFARRALRRGEDEVIHALYPTSAVAGAGLGRPLVFSYMGIPHRQGLANRRKRVEIMLRALARRRSSARRTPPSPASASRCWPTRSPACAASGPARAWC